ncbi:universal stress protein [Terracoccus luteus]|uniref:Nucleotide-binding universal stress UspA family protein n=1 Tax=Terracoccus luteus TaxID=53356 RepID=A0A839Q1W1_9MICO|nr:universal stress protein [Terracoccus luteus]MBB2987072.1 nucleotide-binding universal stress UspA family protein [Terracoccus luteus]MCP2172723.1 nucleotide-binding universal stress UspA family protein [Terracoccus luteus]
MTDAGGPADAGGRGQDFTVVVGVSPSSGSPRALAWAAREAAVRGGRLVAVRAWRPTAPVAATGGRLPSVAADTDADHTTAQTELDAAVAAALGPDHDASTRIVVAGRRTALTQAAEGADLLVLEGPRTGEVSPRWLVGRLLRSVPCPVVVVPVPAGEARSPVAAGARAVGRAAARAAATAGRPGLQRPPT